MYDTESIAIQALAAACKAVDGVIPVDVEIKMKEQGVGSGDFDDARRAAEWDDDTHEGAAKAVESLDRNGLEDSIGTIVGMIDATGEHKFRFVRPAKQTSE